MNTRLRCALVLLSSVLAADAAATEQAAGPREGGGELRIDINAPIDGSRISDRFVAVRGQLFGPADAGVSVNDRFAAVIESGTTRKFFTTVAIGEGENLIEVAATRPNGARVSRQVRVVRAGAPRFSVTATPNSGVAPFDARFEITQYELGGIRHTRIDLGNGMPPIVREGDDRYFEGQYSNSGAFNAKVTITTVDGEVISSTVPVTVLDRAQVDAEIQRVWYALRVAFEAGDAEAALQLFTPDSASRYRVAFTAPGVDLPALAEKLVKIHPAKIDVGFSDYVISTGEAASNQAFPISFMRVRNGGWRLTTF